MSQTDKMPNVTVVRSTALRSLELRRTSKRYDRPTLFYAPDEGNGGLHVATYPSGLSFKISETVVQV